MLKNEAQEEVIHNVYGQTIVIACPGSGKTTTLLRRINYMIKDEHINPSEIVMITFTKAAADEMRERFAKNYGKNKGVLFCTIHAFCFMLLKKFGKYENDAVLTNASDIIFEQIKFNSKITDKMQFVADILTDISVIKNNEIKPSEFDEFDIKCCDDKKIFLQIFKNYEKVKYEQGKLDFDDILIETYKMLKNNKEILDYVRDMYGYIHVDEYQDTNYLQRNIIYLIAGDNGNLTVVGDDDQSIYAFRGARPEIMLNFKKDYPYAKEIYMSTNYRSDSDILKYAGNLIAFNKKRFKKDIIACSKNKGKIQHKSFETKEDEVSYVTSRIKQLIEKGINPNDIAILYRTNSQSIPYADGLMSKNIPFKCNENIASKYSHWIFKDIASYYRMAHGRGTQSDYLNTVNHPQRYMSKVNVKKCKIEVDDMFRVLNNPNQEEWKNEKQLDNIIHYVSILKRLSSIDEPLKFLDYMLRLGDYGDFIDSYSEFRNMDSNDLLSVWRAYENDIKSKNIKTFADWSNYANRYNLMFNKQRNERNGVCLSTMHKSKGLEWKYVFIIDCVEGITPSKKAETIDDIEEERRLFYVAMTRAKNDLTLCSFSSSGKTKSKLSRFIVECNKCS